jgi:hypothetical protein
MSHEGMNDWAMGFGGMGTLFWIVLAVAALAKYLLGAAIVEDRLACTPSDIVISGSRSWLDSFTTLINKGTST